MIDVNLKRVTSLLVSSLLLGLGGCGDNERVGPRFSSAAEPPTFNRMLIVDLPDRGTGALTVTVSADAIDGLFGGGFTVSYDPEMLDLQSVVPASSANVRICATTFDRPTFSPGTLDVGFALTESGRDLEIVELSLVPLVDGTSLLRFDEPEYGADVITRRLIDEKGRTLRGVRWFGGEVAAGGGGSGR